PPPWELLLMAPAPACATSSANRQSATVDDVPWGAAATSRAPPRASPPTRVMPGPPWARFRMKAVWLTAAAALRTPTPPAWAIPPIVPPGPATASLSVDVLALNWSELLEKMAPPVAPPPDEAPAPPSARLLRRTVPLTVSDPRAGAARAPPPAVPPGPPGASPATAWLPLRTESVTTTAGPNE